MGKNKEAIGIFDSGIGGLTVLKEVHSLLPQEELIYLGDTARVPYGTKSRETVLKYTVQNTNFLIRQGVKAIVIACNTASAYGLDWIEKKFKVPVIGVIIPGAKGAAEKTKTKKVGVIGTEGTIRSEAYQKAIQLFDAEIKTVSQACPLLVSLAEEGLFSGEIVKLTLERYLGSFSKENDGIDCLILGCTHYPLLKRAISEVVGSDVNLIDSAVETALILKNVLEEKGLKEESANQGKILFYSTDSPERMQQIGHLFLGQKIKEVSQVDL